MTEGGERANVVIFHPAVDVYCTLCHLTMSRRPGNVGLSERTPSTEAMDPDWRRRVLHRVVYVSLDVALVARDTRP
jgi:hypothetical protein